MRRKHERRHTTSEHKNLLELPLRASEHRHKGVCAFVHGYSRSFHFVFGSSDRDACGFVVDFGQLGWVKSFLDEYFDHTLLLCEDDPLLPAFRAIEQAGGAKIRLLPYGVGMESTAQWVCEWVNGHLISKSLGRCWVISVEVRENDKNSGIYINPRN